MVPLTRALPEMSRLSLILVSTSPSAPMTAVREVRAVEGRGLEGDRYFFGKGTFSPAVHRPDHEVTLVESEQIAAFAAASGLPFDAAMARRNLVTEGSDLNALVGQTFEIGEVVLRGIRLCEPCNYLAKTTYPETLAGLMHRGGLRAQIVRGGVLRVGDAVRPVPPGLS